MDQETYSYGANLGAYLLAVARSVHYLLPCRNAVVVVPVVVVLEVVIVVPVVVVVLVVVLLVLSYVLFSLFCLFCYLAVVIPN